MSTIKSSSANLTLNADGSNSDIIIQSNGSTKVTLDGQNSRVGIGTTAPVSLLHAQLPSNSTASLFTFDRSDGAVRGEIKYDDTNAVRGFEIGTTTSHDISLKTAGNKRLQISYTGNVGIGVAPVAWNAALRALQISETGAISGGNTAWGGYLEIGSNFYRSESGFKYITADKACLTEYDNANGRINHKVAASGSANASLTLLTRGTFDADGLKFNGDTAAANALNDFEEGNHASAWTSDSGSITVGRNDVAYTKIGNMVHCTGEVTISSVSSPAGSRMSLPFTIASHTVDRNMNWGSQGMACYSVAQHQDNPPCLYGSAGASFVNLLYQQDDGAFANYSAAAGDTFMFSFSYKTSA